MFKQKDTASKKSKTKQPHSTSNRRISGICRVIVLLAIIKLGLLANLAVIPMWKSESFEPLGKVDLTGFNMQQSFSATLQEGSLSQTALPPVMPEILPEVLPVAVIAEKQAPVAAQVPGQAPVTAPGSAVEEGQRDATAQDKTADAEAKGDISDVQAALVAVSSYSAGGMTRILGASVAYAADIPSMPDFSPPVPSIRPMDSPIAPPIAPQNAVRQNESTPEAPPPPVAPFVSRDSASQRQIELNRREQELMALQQQMESRLVDLHTLENRLQGMLNDANTTQDQKFRQLVDMYANMKPRVAAQSLSNMDEELAVRILSGMKSKEAGDIMSYMDPLVAARLSEVMSKMQMQGF